MSVSSGINQLTYELRGSFFEVYNTLGPGFKEEIYQKALEREFCNRTISFEKKKKISVLYKNEKIGIYQPDFVINQEIIIEIKAVPQLLKLHQLQLYYYLKSTDCSLGFLVNFWAEKIDIKRCIFEISRKKSAVISLCHNQRSSVL